MATQRLLEQFRAELRKRGLPRAYIERSARELGDHLQDLMEETMSTDISNETPVLEQRIGTPQHLADAAVDQLRQHHFAGRHPIATFVVAPLFTVVAGVVLFIATFVAIAWGAAFVADVELETLTASQVTPLISAFIAVFCYGLGLIPFALSAVLFCKLGNRVERSWRWTMTACGILAVFAGVFYTQLRLPETPGNGQFLVGLGFPLGWGQIVQFLVPLAIGWYYTRPRRDFHQAQPA